MKVILKPRLYWWLTFKHLFRVNRTTANVGGRIIIHPRYQSLRKLMAPTGASYVYPKPCNDNKPDSFWPWGM